MILSNPVQKEEILKVKIRPIVLHGEIMFQAEEFIGKQTFHKNLNKEEAIAYIAERLNENFRQAELISALGTGMVLVSKKGAMTVKMKKTAVAGGGLPAGISGSCNSETSGSPQSESAVLPGKSVSGQMKILPYPVVLSHNRQKRYVLQ